MPDCLEAIERCAYEVIAHYALPEETWWTEYYGPLEARIQELRAKWGHDPEVADLLDAEQRGAESYRESREWYGSAFFVMQAR